MGSFDENDKPWTMPEEVLKEELTKPQEMSTGSNLEGTSSKICPILSELPSFFHLALGQSSSSDSSTSPDSSPTKMELVGLPKEAFPNWFLCPISSEVMNNPVVLETGETYDRDYIRKWIADGNLTCPKTQKVLMGDSLIPNLLVKRLISQWTTHGNFDLPQLMEMGKPTESSRLEVHKQFEKITSSDIDISARKKAAVILRNLTNKSKSCRTHLAEIGNSITTLLTLASDDTDGNADFKEQLALTVSSLCVDQENRDLFCQSDQRMLVEIIKKGETMLTRTTASSAIYFLLNIEDNKRTILDMGILIPIRNLFASGDSNTRKVTCSILLSFCKTFPEAVETLVESGKETVRALVSAAKVSTTKKQALAILALMSKHHKSTVEIMGMCGVGWLLDIISNTEEDDDCLFAAMVTLHSILLSTDDFEVWTAVEDRSGHFFMISETGHENVKFLAGEILTRLNWARKGKSVVPA